MEISIAQQEAVSRGKKMGIENQKPLEIIAAITEELGEVVTEVALFEQIGNKVNWKRKADKQLLAREISQLLINVMSLASHYDINMDEAFQDLLESSTSK